jgi:MFS family permease
MTARAVAVEPPAPLRFGAAAWRLIACYGVFGYGYILPATFLPALGRQLFPDPAVFGWAWPVFGLAAAVSTIAAGGWLVRAGARRVFVAGVFVAALGVAAPAVSPGLATLIASALCVGGSFMVVTMAAFQLAREGASTPAAGARVVAAMTAAFALGQLLGPLTVHAPSPGGAAAGSLAATLVVPSLAAAGLLIVAALAMLAGRRPAPIEERRT